MLVASWHFCDLGLIGRVISADTDSHRVLLRQTHILRPNMWIHGTHMMFTWSVNRTQLLERLALLGLESLLIFSSLREVYSRTSGGQSYSILLTWVQSALACISLLGHAISVDSCLLSWAYWTGLLLYLWGTWKVDWAVTTESWKLNCWLPKNTDGICSKSQFLNKSTSTVS